MIDRYNRLTFNRFTPAYTMKKRIKLIFPVPMNEHTKDMVESQIPAELIGDNFQVEFAGS